MTMTRRADAPPTPTPATTTPASDAPARRRTASTGTSSRSKAPRTGATRSAAAAADAGGVAFVEPLTIPIQKATDLGSVQVLKHGNLYLLTDPFGDIHPDSRGL
ncbi:MAG TPA: hypothetical protein VNM34_07595, partial [Verrucomicrobiae bacterium]|nr:hypothetical protein [Verrucomicrobiae bacterium]